MRVIAAMNAFKGSMTSQAASRAVAHGFRKGFPEATMLEIPMADGGDGTLDVLVGALGGHVETVVVKGPYGSPVSAPIGLVETGSTAIIESAKASGLALAKPHERDVRIAQSSGVGQLMLWAARRGVKHIIVGVGGTAMNDGGIGAVLAAGGVIRDVHGCPVPPGTLGLASVHSVSLGDIPKNFKGVKVTVLADVMNLLVGPDGATSVYGPQKGITPEEIPSVDRDMGMYARILARDLGKDPSRMPMAGAGGGLAAGLWAFFDASLVQGSQYVIEKTGFRNLLRQDVHLVITGEGRVDSQTSSGKIPYAVAQEALETGVPCIVIGGGLSPAVVKEYPDEFVALFDSTIGPMSAEEAISMGADTLAFEARQIGSLARAFWLARPTRKETCAGGIVIREKGGIAEVLLIGDKYGMMALPKGHVDSHESFEEAAVREVSEETGLSVTITAYIGDVRYRFLSNEEVVEKTVHYYAMEAVGGEAKPQPGETTVVTWVALPDLPRVRTYRGTLSIVHRALRVWERIT